MDVRRKQLLSYQRRLLPLGLRVAGFRPRHLSRCTAFSNVRMKRFIILTLFLTSCSASAVQENPNFVVAQNNGISNVMQNKASSTIAQENNKFQAIIPKATWEKIFFEGINERVKSSKLKSLRSKALPKGDLEIRIWSGFGISLLEGFVLKRSAGEWSAIDLDWEVTEKSNGKRDIKQVDKKLDVPKSGWEAAWQKLVDAGILTLPDPEDSNCRGDTVDGMSYVVEYNFNNTYRTYMYDNPEVAIKDCPEYKPMLKINQIIAEEFYRRES
jgi:hypothetical protein